MTSVAQTSCPTWFGNHLLWLSSAYMMAATINCFMLLVHLTPWACALARAKAGNNIAARMAMIAMTTRSSINVKAPASWITPRNFIRDFFIFCKYASDLRLRIDFFNRATWVSLCRYNDQSLGHCQGIIFKYFLIVATICRGITWRNSSGP